MFIVAKIKNGRLWRWESTSCPIIIDLSVIANPPLVICTRENTMDHMCLLSTLTFCDYRLSTAYISILWWIWMTNSSLEWTVGYLIYQLAVRFTVEFCILWTNFGIDVISLQLWPAHNRSHHHRWSLLMVSSHVHYYYYWPQCQGNPYWGQHRR